MRRTLLVAVEAFVGVAAVVGGTLLAAAPDGRLLGAATSVLTGTPFADYLVPGIMLAVFVGAGGVSAAVLTLRRTPYARRYAALYAAGVIVFEAVEYALIGWNPQQAIIAALGLAILLLAVTPQTSGAGPRRPARAG